MTPTQAREAQAAREMEEALEAQERQAEELQAAHREALAQQRAHQAAAEEARLELLRISPGGQPGGQREETPSREGRGTPVRSPLRSTGRVRRAQTTGAVRTSPDLRLQSAQSEQADENDSGECSLLCMVYS
jgi:hypothetical protein